MKKSKLLVLLLAVVMVFSVVALVACNNGTTYTGEYSYEAWSHTYGAKVDVTVKEGKITAVKVYTDEESGWINLSAAQDEGTAWTETNRALWTDGQADYVNSFVGKTVEEVNGYKATIDGQNSATANSVSCDHVTGATQSSARVLLAIQNALSKIVAE